MRKGPEIGPNFDEKLHGRANPGFLGADLLRVKGRRRRNSGRILKFFLRNVRKTEIYRTTLAESLIGCEISEIIASESPLFY